MYEINKFKVLYSNLGEKCILVNKEDKYVYKCIGVYNYIN